jgi:superfamily II DNA/RNA helicase
LGLSDAAGSGLAAGGYVQPTPIQTLALPTLLRGASAALLAETGSGKTLCYALPLLTRAYGDRARVPRVPATSCPQLLFVVPTRELGLQVLAAAQAAALWCCPDDVPRPAAVMPLLGRDKRRAAAVMASGGRPPAASPARGGGGDEEDEPLSPAAFEASDVVVATPRAALQALHSGRLRLGRLAALVLDEADELLSPGFAPDIEALLALAVPARATCRGVFGQPVQLVAAAATLGRAQWDGALRRAWPGALERVASPGLHRPAAALRQRVVAVQGDAGRQEALLAALGDSGDAPGLPALVFASTPAEADEVAAALAAAGLPAASCHGRSRGRSRGELLDELQAGLLAVLVVTDASARGLDLPCLRNVVQWRPAPSAALHLHRIGRTARAGAPGACQATALLDPCCAVDGAMGAFGLLHAALLNGGVFDDGELIDTRRQQE